MNGLLFLLLLGVAVIALAVLALALAGRVIFKMAARNFTRRKAQSAIEKVCVLLRSQTGHDFSLYKRSTVYRRIERRMGLHQIDSIAAYVRYLQESLQERQLLFKELLIGVTSFFRDPPAWDRLKMQGLPALIAGRPAGGTQPKAETTKS